MNLPCMHCGDTMTDRVRPHSKYCSQKCKDLARTAIRQAERERVQADRRCAFCNSPMDPSVWSRAVCCSKTCSWKYQNKKSAAQRKSLRAMRERPCARCQTLIPPERGNASKFCSSQCKKLTMADNYRARYPGYQRMRNYGLTQERFDAMVAEQAGRCAICGTDNPAGRRGGLHVDHDHVTGSVRALLCGNCNIGLGNFQDDPALLRAAADYLERHTVAPM